MSDQVDHDVYAHVHAAAYHYRCRVDGEKNVRLHARDECDDRWIKTGPETYDLHAEAARSARDKDVARSRSTAKIGLAAVDSPIKSAKQRL